MPRTCNLARLSLYTLSWVQLARCGFKPCTPGATTEQPGLGEIFWRVKASHSTRRCHAKACTREPRPTKHPRAGASSAPPQAPGEETNKLKFERLGHITACWLMSLCSRLMLVSVELLFSASQIASLGKETLLEQI